MAEWDTLANQLINSSFLLFRIWCSFRFPFIFHHHNFMNIPWIIGIWLTLFILVSVLYWWHMRFFLMTNKLRFCWPFDGLALYIALSFSHSLALFPPPRSLSRFLYPFPLCMSVSNTRHPPNVIHEWIWHLHQMRIILNRNVDILWMNLQFRLNDIRTNDVVCWLNLSLIYTTNRQQNRVFPGEHKVNKAKHEHKVNKATINILS